MGREVLCMFESEFLNIFCLILSLISIKKIVIKLLLIYIKSGLLIVKVLIFNIIWVCKKLK